jgi:hypothetical protein
MAKRKTALVIVHLSSLDAYTEMGHEVEGDDAGGEDLAFWVERAIMEHKGPVYVIDQGWEFHPHWSRPRKGLLDAIRFRKDIAWMRFDEAEEPWDPFLKEFEKTLRENVVTDVILGGIWFDPQIKGGCVTQVYSHLKSRFRTKVNRDIVGCETDFDESEPPNDYSGPVPAGLS